MDQRKSVHVIEIPEHETGIVDNDLSVIENILSWSNDDKANFLKNLKAELGK